MAPRFRNGNRDDGLPSVGPEAEVCDGTVRCGRATATAEPEPERWHKPPGEAAARRGTMARVTLGRFMCDRSKPGSS